MNLPLPETYQYNRKCRLCVVLGSIYCERAKIGRIQPISPQILNDIYAVGSSSTHRPLYSDNSASVIGRNMRRFDASAVFRHRPMRRFYDCPAITTIGYTQWHTQEVGK